MSFFSNILLNLIKKVEYIKEAGSMSPKTSQSNPNGAVSFVLAVHINGQACTGPVRFAAECSCADDDASHYFDHCLDSLLSVLLLL